MSVTDKVRKLVSEGRTQMALDTLQAELNQPETKEIVNQTYLLEGQFKDLTKKGDLGLDDVQVDINRINMALLRICDEIDTLLPEKEPETATEPLIDMGTKRYLSNPLVIFGGLTGVAALMVAFFMRLGGEKTPAQPTKPPAAPRLTVVFDTTSQTLTLKNKVDVRLKLKQVNFKSAATTGILTVEGTVRCLAKMPQNCELAGTYFKLLRPDNTLMATAQASTLPNFEGGQGAAFVFDFEIPTRAQTLALVLIHPKKGIILQQNLNLKAE